MNSRPPGTSAARIRGSAKDGGLRAAAVQSADPEREGEIKRLLAALELEVFGR